MEPIRPLDNKTVTEVPRPLNTVQRQHIPRKIVLEAAGHGVCREADIRHPGLQGHVLSEDGSVGMGGVKIAHEFCTWKLGCTMHCGKSSCHYLYTLCVVLYADEYTLVYRL